MSDEPDMTQRPGWKAVERWLSENESPPPKPTIHKPIAKWGTRGLTAGCAAGFIFVLAVLMFDGEPSGKSLLAFPIFMGILGIPCALVGMLIGFAIWLFRRD
jgi:ABC-type multidrug transport system permease subunit